MSKSPPSYAARRAEDVALLQKQQAEAEAARQAAETWRAAVAAARAAKTRAQQPTAAEWQTGPFAHRVAALKVGQRYVWPMCVGNELMCTTTV